MSKWATHLQSVAGGCEFYGPDDMGNPAPGYWVVRGPTSEIRHSPHSIEHAAIVYLVHVCRDAEAKKAIATFDPTSDT